MVTKRDFEVKVNDAVDVVIKRSGSSKPQKGQSPKGWWGSFLSQVFSIGGETQTKPVRKARNKRAG